jgi:ribosome maturation factor RimP
VGRKEDILGRIRAIAEPLADGEGLELVDAEITGAGGRSVLRLYIDKKGGTQLPAQPGVGVDPGASVSLEDCSTLSRAVSAALDVEDPLEGAYDLEVSSPGLDRPLRKPEHFVKYAGQRIRLKTYGPIESAGGRKSFIGKLLGMTGDLVRVEVDGREYEVPLSQVGKANIEPVIEF